MRPGVIRPDLKRPAVACLGLVQATKIIEGSAQVVMRPGEIRLDLQCPAVTGLGLGETTQLLEGNAQIIMRLGIMRRQRYRFLHRRQRVCSPPHLLEHCTQNLPAKLVLREVNGHRLGHGGRFRVAPLAEQSPQGIDPLRCGRFSLLRGGFPDSFISAFGLGGFLAGLRGFRRDWQRFLEGLLILCIRWGCVRLSGQTYCQRSHRVSLQAALPPLFQHLSCNIGLA